MNSRSLLAALATAVVALPCSGFAFAGDRFEWPELPYEPCFRVERVLAPSDICSQGGGAFGRAINAHGTIVGDANCGAGNSRAFIWRMTESFQWIPTPQGTNYSWAWAINDDGLVAGSLGNGHGFAWHEGTGEFQLILSPFGSGAISPYAINVHGVIVGTIFVVGQPGVTQRQGFIWQDGVLTRLEDLYDFGGRNHIPVDIDDEGTIVGYFPAGDGGTAEARPFLIKDGTLFEFDPFPKGWNGAVPGALLHDGVFMAESWHNPDMPNVRVAAYGNARGFVSQVPTVGASLRVAPIAGNAFGDAVGARMDLSGVAKAVVIRHGVLHLLRDFTVGPYTDYGVARGLSSDGQLASGPSHLVPAPPPLGDLSRNCRRDLSDLPLLLGQWGPGESPADLNDDGRVDLEDLLILLRLIADDLSL